VVSEVESAIRWISYLTAASKYTNSHVVSEFLYTAANLIQLLNDSILRKAANLRVNVDASIGHLQTLLQVLEYTSVFSEFTANQYAGQLGKWIILASFQTAKAVIKLVLLLKYKQGLQRQQPLLPLDRRSDLICLQRNHNQNLNNNRRQQELLREAEIEAEALQAEVVVEQIEEIDHQPSSSTNDNDSTDTQTLRRSGRVMRTLEKAPPRSQRTWMLPTADLRFRQMIEKNKKDAPPSQLTDNQTMGEMLHIIKPVAHLGAMAGLGTMAWTPYFLSLGLDLASLKLLHEPKDKVWNLNESVELGQRSFALLLYLLRSPFYDRYTKERILRSLSLLSDHVPIIGRFIRPLVSYLPEWQRTYFYVWGV
jgi:peroxin-16